MCDVEKFQMWRHFRCGENLDVKKFSGGEKLDVEKFGMYRVKDDIIHIVLPWHLKKMGFVLFCSKVCLVAIYTVLSRKLFWRNLRTFYVEKN